MLQHWTIEICWCNGVQTSFIHYPSLEMIRAWRQSWRAKKQKLTERCTGVDFPPTVWYKQSFGLILSDSHRSSSFYSWSKELNTHKKKTRIDFPPTDSYQQCFGLIPLDSHRSSSFYFWSQQVNTHKKKRIDFPPYGFISAEFWFNSFRFALFYKFLFSIKTSENI